MVDVSKAATLNKRVIKIIVKDGKGTMLEEVKTAYGEAKAKLEELETKLNAAVNAPNLEKEVLDALLQALESKGYTVTPPSAS